MNRLYVLILVLLMTGCSSVNFPQREPLTEQEQISFTCAEIIHDMNQTQAILDVLNSTDMQATTGTAVGATALLAVMGGVNFDLIGTPIAHAQAMHKTQTRFEQLQALFDAKDCQQELMMPKRNVPILQKPTEESVA